MDKTSKLAIVFRLSFSPIFIPVLLLGVIAKMVYVGTYWFFNEMFYAFGYGFKGPEV